MRDTFLGSIIIDSQLNIIGFNKDMETLFPKICKGEKCYSVLAEGSTPCIGCPISSKDINHYTDTAKCPYTDITEVSITPENKLFMLTFKSGANKIKPEPDTKTAAESLYI